MAGDANLIEQAVQLSDDGGDLLGQVARVHRDCRASRQRRSSCQGACTYDRRAGGVRLRSRGMYACCRVKREILRLCKGAEPHALRSGRAEQNRTERRKAQCNCERLCAEAPCDAMLGIAGGDSGRSGLVSAVYFGSPLPR